MSYCSGPVRANKVETTLHLVTLEGTGTSALTVLEGGSGMTITRTGVGAHTITWASNPGKCLGWSAQVGGATLTNVDGFGAVRTAYVPATKTMTFTITDELFAAHDLSTTEFIDIQVWFSSNDV